MGWLLYENPTGDAVVIPKPKLPGKKRYCKRVMANGTLSPVAAFYIASKRMVSNDAQGAVQLASTDDKYNDDDW